MPIDKRRVADTGLSIVELEKVFIENPKVGRDGLRQLKKQEHAEFLRQAIQFLEHGASNCSSSSYSQVVLQLCREDAFDLSQMLFAADLLSMEEAARLLRISSRNDPAYQAHLITSVKKEIDKAGAGMANIELTRLLEILAKSVDPEKLGGMLASLCEHPDERLRSKVALLCGSLVRHLPKRSDLLRDIDPRVRANAVEALWGRRDVESLQLLKQASLDENHRVAANGLYGLYVGGDVSAIRGILKLSRESDLARQLAGIWLLGQTGNPRFQNVIHENLSVMTGRVKFSLLNAGRKIKKRMDELRQLDPLRVSVVHFDRSETGRVRCSFLLARSSGTSLKADELLGTQVVIQDGDLKVDQYHFEARGGDAATYVAMLIPLRVGMDQAFAQQLVAAMEMAIAKKRSQDLWTIQKYKLQAGAGAPETIQAAFLPLAERLRADQLRSVKGSAENVFEGVEQLVRAFPSEAGRRQIVLLLDPSLGEEVEVPAFWEVLFENHGVILHVVSCMNLKPSALSSWSKFCASRRGIFAQAVVPSDLPATVQKIASGLPMHFHCTYELSRSIPNSDPLERVTWEFVPAAGYGRVVMQKNGEVEPEVKLEG